MVSDYDEQVERLAEIAHEAWSGWMRWMLPNLGLATEIEGYGWSQTKWSADELPNYAQPHLQRWLRQMQTPYAELSEKEKESDRDEARKYIAALTTTPERPS